MLCRSWHSHFRLFYKLRIDSVNFGWSCRNGLQRVLQPGSYTFFVLRKDFPGPRPIPVRFFVRLPAVFDLARIPRGFSCRQWLTTSDVLITEGRRTLLHRRRLHLALTRVSLHDLPREAICRERVNVRLGTLLEGVSTRRRKLPARLKSGGKDHSSVPRFLQGQYKLFEKKMFSIFSRFSKKRKFIKKNIFRKSLEGLIAYQKVGR